MNCFDYFLFLVGIPNLVGVMLGYIIESRLRGRLKNNTVICVGTMNFIESFGAALVVGSGTGAVGIGLARIFGDQISGEKPLISTVFWVLYSIAKKRSGIVVWGGVIGIYTVWVIYWLAVGTN